MSRIPLQRPLIALIIASFAFVALSFSGTIGRAEQQVANLFLAPNITATKTAALAVGGDVDGDSRVDPGDKLQYTVTIQNTGSDASNVKLSDLITDPNLILDPSSISNSVLAFPDSYNAVANLSMSQTAGALTNNDRDPFNNSNAGLVTIAQTISSANCTAACSNNVTIGADGSFTYDPPAGFTGSDTFTYQVKQSAGSVAVSGTATVDVSGPVIWYVNNNAGACPSAPCDGRFSHPFTSLANFVVANGGGTGKPTSGDSIFVYESATPYTGGVTLLANQKLIGQDAATTLAVIAGVALPLPDGSSALPTMNAGGNSTTITNGLGNDVTLSSGNTLDGFTAGNATGPAISGVGFGTVTVADVTINSTGQAIALAGGTVAGSGFISTTTAGANYVVLNNVGGSLALGTGSMSGATLAGFSILNGGSVNVTYSGNISQASNAPMVSIAGGHTGTVTFSSGTLNATNGSGLQFDNADGTYNFNGTNTLHGGDAGIDILNGSSGNFSFSSGTVITDPSGNAFKEDTSTANVTYNGTITKANNAIPAVFINAKTGGTTTLAGTITADTSSGSSTPVALINNTGGTINFNGLLTLTAANATGFSATGGGTVTTTNSANTVATTTGTGVSISGMAIGAGGLKFNGITTTGGTGVNMTGFTGTATISGITTSSGGSGVNLSNFTGTANFSGLNISSGSNAGFISANPSLQGTVNVTGSTNTISSTSGASISVTNTNIGASGMTFMSIAHNASNSGTNSAIVLNNTGSGTFSVTGNAGTCTTATPICTGGTIQNIQGADAVSLNTVGGLVTLTNMLIEDISASNDSSAANDTRSGVDAIQGQAVSGGLTLNNSIIQRVSDSGINGSVGSTTPSGTVFNGLTITNCAILNTGRFNVAGHADAQNEAAIYVFGVKGTVSVTGSTFQNDPTGIDFTTDTSGSLDMTVTGNTFNTLYKEPGGTASVGNWGVRVLQEGSLNSVVRIGDKNDSNAALGNTFTNGGRLAAIEVIAENTSTGTMKAEINRNTSTVTDHTTPGVAAGSTSYNFPQGGTLLRARGSGNYEAIYGHNMCDQCMHADQATIGQLTISVEKGTAEFLVQNNTFKLPWDSPVQIISNGTGGAPIADAQIKFTGNTYISGTVGDGTTDLGGTSPFNPFYAQTQNGGRLDLTIQNEGAFAPNDPSSGFSHAFHSQTTSVNDIFNLFLQNTTSSTGYELKASSNAGAQFNLYKNGSVQSTVQGVLNDNGDSGTAFLTGAGTVTLTNTAPVAPSITIAAPPPVIDDVMAPNGLDQLEQLVPSRRALKPIEPVQSGVRGRCDWNSPEPSACKGGVNVPLQGIVGLIVQQQLDEWSAVAQRSMARDSSSSLDSAVKNDAPRDSVTAPLQARISGTFSGEPAYVHSVSIRSRISDFFGSLVAAVSPTAMAQSERPEVEVGSKPKDPQQPSAVNSVCLEGDGNYTCDAGSPGFTLPAGGSVTVSFQATTNATVPAHTAAYTTVSNQGSVTAAGPIGILTDDPGTGTPNDATVTTMDTTTVAVTSDGNPASVGQNITFTATLTGVPVRGETMTGTVTFFADGVQIGSPVNVTGDANAGTAQASISTLTNGAHVITAEYSGDANFNPDVGTLAGGENIVAPPQITKLFGQANLALNGTTGLTFNITNPAGNTAPLTGVAFTDNMPAGLVVAATPNLSSTCGGTSTALAGSGLITLTGGTIAGGSSCTVSVNVTGTTSGVKTNSVTVSSDVAGTGNTSVANITVALPPSITKSFAAAQIPVNGTTALNFVISNPGGNVDLTGVGFTDAFPAGLVVASGGTTSCGGVVTAIAGGGSASFSGGTIAAGASCLVTVNITSASPGTLNNSVQVTSAEGGNGNISNASITVVAPPTLSKVFGAASIAVNGETTLTFAVSNPNTTTALSGVAFTDTLPAGLVVSTPNGSSGNCGAGTITANAGSNSVSLSGGTIAASGGCTFSVNVKGTAAGTQVNTTGAVTSTEGGTGGTATASINVEAPPSIAKAFSPSTIALNGTTSLTFTITNPAANVQPLTGVAFTDTLPAGLTVASSSSAVCGGTLTTTSPTGIALSGATINAGGQCQFSVTVTGTTSGQYTNTTGNVTSSNGGTGNTASAPLTVASPPTIAKVFGAAAIAQGTNTTLQFTVTNPNASIPLTGVAFTDSLPAGIVVATPNGVAGTCDGTLTATAGSGSVTLTGATLAGGASCTMTVSVTGSTSGVKNNTVSVTSTEGGAGTNGTASITVVAPPALIKKFGAASIVYGETTVLGFTVTNPNTTVGLTGVSFTDSLPAGLRLANSTVTGTCGAGTITAAVNNPPATASTVTLSGGDLAASGTCAFTVNVTGIGIGLQTNTTSTISSTEGGTGTAATAAITVNKADTQTALTSTQNPTVFGQSVTFTATVTASAPGSGTPTGTVLFFDGATQIGSVSLNGSGAATLSTGTLAVGSHTITTTYAGDPNFNGSNGTLTGNPQVVNKADTTTAVVSSTNPSVFGQGVTFTATVAPVSPGAGTPTGTVTFFDGATPLCTGVALDGSSQASCQTSALSVASHPVTVQYTGDGSFNGSTSPVLSQVVDKASTATALTSTANPSVTGQSVTFTATVTPVSPGAGSPTGTIQFKIDGVNYGAPVALVGGVAQTNDSALTAAGSPHAVQAVYSGDGNFVTSTGSVSQAVNKADTTTTITNAAALGTPSTINTAYPVTWTVTVNSPGAGTPTGTVTVSDGTDTCSAPVAAGTCQLTSTTTGTKTITATYSGDAGFNTSTSTGVSHLVIGNIGGNIKQYNAPNPNTNLSGVTVTLTGSNNTTVTQTTDALGNYLFTGLVAGVTYKVTPTGLGKVYDPISKTYPNFSQNITNADFVAYNSNAIPRDLKMGISYVVPGQPITVPVTLTSVGTETSLAFSILYDINPFVAPPTVTCGAASGANCTIIIDNSQTGKLGITVTPQAGTYTAGSDEVVKLNFQTLATTLYNTPLTFGDAPTVRVATNAASDPLPLTYTNGWIVFQQGIEGDVATRTTGDGQLLANDVTIVRSFVVGSLPPDLTYNEFQRADTAPRGTLGDGQINASDVIQERRYVLGLDAPTAAGGPFTSNPGGPIAPPVNIHDAGRAMKVSSTNAVAGNKVSVDVTLDAVGDEAATSFTLNFDAMKLSNPTVTLGSGAPADSTLTVGTADAKDGRVSILIDSMNSFEKAAGKQVVTVTFDVAAKAPTGDTEISLSAGSISDTQARDLTASYTSGKISIGGPNAVGVSISGRILTPEGAGLRNAVVTLTDAAGNVRTANSASLGYYTFDSVPTGAEYTITVTSKRYRFSSRKLTTRDNLADVNFTGTE